MPERRSLAPFVILMLLLAAIAIQLARPPRARAGAWTREPGGLFLKVGLDRWATSDRIDDAGRTVGYARDIHGAAGGGGYSASALRGYLEYGWRDGWTAIAAGSIERLDADYGSARLSSAGIGDLYLSLRRRVLPGPLVLSVQADAKLPTFYDESESPALGTGKPDAGGRVLAGASIGSLYATAEAGWLARGGARANEMPYAIEAGWAPTTRLLVRGELRGSATLGAAGASGGSGAVPGMFDPALATSRWLAAGGGLVVRGMPLDLVFDVSHVLEGRNTLAGTRLGVSIWYER
jgi:hypothetical protein